jgi:2,5-diketo-D-gluconate reductase B
MTRMIPPIGLGTWGLTGREGVAIMRQAIDLGYRHFDTAQTYDTEAGIAEAIAQSGVPRSDIFVTTKIADTKLSARDLLPSLRESLRRLNVEQVDLTLIHWPVPDNAVPLEEYICQLGEAKARGMTREIGVSNFPSVLLQRAAAVAGHGEIFTNQVELHPFLQGPTLQSLCARLGVRMTAYMPLARGAVARDPVVRRIADRLDASPASVTLAWHRQRGRVAIPSSRHPEHLRQNLESLALLLTAEDLAAIDGLDRGERIINPAKSPAWD